MENTITLTLSDEEYRELLVCYHVGFLAKDTVYAGKRTQEEMLRQIELMEKIDIQAVKSGSKYSFMQPVKNSIKENIEDEVLEILDEFRDYIESGEASDDDEMIRKQIEEFKKSKKKSRKK